MIILTGATGFIGQELIFLASKKYPNEEIYCLIKGKNNLTKKRNIKIIPVDLLTKYNLNKIPVSPRLVFHLAGTTDTSIRNHDCIDVGTENLLKNIKKLGPKTHIIYTSSLAVYSGRRDCDRPIGAQTQPVATNEYGRSKLRAEKILLDTAKNQKFRLTIIRLPTVWGENPRKNSFLNFLRKLVNTNSLFSRLNWPGKVGLINVDDAAKYLLEIAEKPAKSTQIIPVSIQNLTMAEIFEKLTIAKGKKYRRITIPNLIWNSAKKLRPYLKYFESILPAYIYNYLWRASIVVDSPLWCRVNVKGTKFVE